MQTLRFIHSWVWSAINHVPIYLKYLAWCGKKKNETYKLKLISSAKFLSSAETITLTESADATWYKTSLSAGISTTISATITAVPTAVTFTVSTTVITLYVFHKYFDCSICNYRYFFQKELCSYIFTSFKKMKWNSRFSAQMLSRI